MPRALWSSAASVYAVRIPEPGKKIKANEIQKPPYDEKAGR